MRQKIVIYAFFPMLLLCSAVTIVSGQTKLINPQLSNNFIDSYLLPDSTIRFIGSEHGRNRELFYVDKFMDGTIAEPIFFPESLGDLDFNFAGVDCKLVPLKSGDVLMSINQSDCDYPLIPAWQDSKLTEK
ncbi:MAG: hypothetical protein SH808_14090 [Saprospiraceae bacterium]|nr:hypothetical protein [Saprospiraceae bacterium]